LNPIIQAQIERLLERHEEVGALLATQEVLSDQNRFRNLSKEYARLDDLVLNFREHQQFKQQIDEALVMRNDPDPALRALAQEELAGSEEALAEIEQRLQKLLLPADPNDEANVFLEVRAGTGGDEAAIFAGDLFRMYHRYAETQGWQVEVLSSNAGEHGGYKEIIAQISGQGVYSRLKFESGAHRVQRVPATESQGRIHTSACTVAILPEAEEIEAVEINPSDLRVDTYRASGAGGQHVNKTDSAVRLTHLPTGIVVECQDERSQHKNRARAMSLLKARIFDEKQSKQNQERSDLRRSLVGSGDRSERIRTYNFPQGRITDHRINVTLYQLEDIIGGNLSPLLGALQEAHEADLLAQLSR